MKRLLQFIGVCVVMLLPVRTLAQTNSPPLPQGDVLNFWPFDTNLLSARGFGSRLATNLTFVPSWNDFSLQMDDTNPSILVYDVVDTDVETGLPQTNLALTRGSVETVSGELDLEYPLEMEH